MKILNLGQFHGLADMTCTFNSWHGFFKINLGQIKFNNRTIYLFYVLERLEAIWFVII